ncbi:MAG: PIN domain-containing protein [Bacteroidaceae bacterium]|nr:PIN domain-containing protein [Bacteroidaceae bacterium]
MTKLFLDTNVVMDLLQRREPFFLAAANIFALSAKGEVELYASPMTYATASYLIGKRDLAKVKPLLAELRTLSHVTTANEDTVDQSLASAFNDYEDALQHFSALNQHIDYIITRNKEDFSCSQIRVLTPIDFLSSFNR